MKNLNLIFNKLCYEDLGKETFSNSLEEYNKQILETKFDHAKDYKKLEVPHQSFIMKTTYPGLLIGTGNPHGTGKSKEDINVGFSFDYVTGQPYIPGSSVKGMLRSCFKNSPEIIGEIIGKEQSDVKALEKEIFDEDKDVFFDAVLFDGNEYGLVMGEDYITPHREATKDPIPIKMIKVLPDVRFEFRFDAKDGILKAAEKVELFDILLRIFGVGAKTNVGYGVLENADDEITPKKQRKTYDTSKYNPQQSKEKQQKTQNGKSVPSQNKSFNSSKDYKSNKPNDRKADGGEKVKCPNCGWFVFKYKRFSNELETTCFKCGSKLYLNK